MAFLTWYRLCKRVIMPMGLRNMRVTFILMMNNLFVDLLDKRVVFFLDDVLLYSTKMEKHFKLVQKVFTHFCKHAFYCNLKKLSFL